MIIEEITINQYIKAWYKKSYDEYTKEQIEQAYCEYMDLSGLYESKQFQQIAYINYLRIRIATLSSFVEVEKQFVETFGEPYDDFEIAKIYNYKLSWKGDKDDFLSQLNKINSKERKYVIELKQKEKVYEDEKSKSKVNQKSLQEDRTDFIRNITVLSKNGYVINRSVTTMEEYSIMIKDTLEQNKSENAKQSFKHRDRHTKP